MSLQSQAAASLNALPSFAHSLHATSVDCQEAGQRLHAELVAHESMALAFQRFELDSAALAKASIEQLKAVAEDLSNRLTYLLEPISPVEVDSGKCVVQLRSNPPQRDENGASYYELLVAAGRPIEPLPLDERIGRSPPRSAGPSHPRSFLPIRWPT